MNPKVIGMLATQVRSSPLAARQVAQLTVTSACSALKHGLVAAKRLPGSPG